MEIFKMTLIIPLLAIVTFMLDRELQPRYDKVLASNAVQLNPEDLSNWPKGKWDLQLDCINMDNIYPFAVPGNVKTYDVWEWKWSEMEQTKVRGSHYLCFITREEQCAELYKDKENQKLNIDAYCKNYKEK